MKPKPWSPLNPPKLIAVTGHRDTTTGITYLPFADPEHGVMGWEMIPHLGKGFLVYIIPTLDRGKFEIRVHTTMEEPNPETDRCIGVVELPEDLIPFSE
jgi:hypothetical protein